MLPSFTYEEERPGRIVGYNRNDYSKNIVKKLNSLRLPSETLLFDNSMNEFVSYSKRYILYLGNINADLVEKRARLINETRRMSTISNRKIDIYSACTPTILKFLDAVPIDRMRRLMYLLNIAPFVWAVDNKSYRAIDMFNIGLFVLAVVRGRSEKDITQIGVNGVVSPP